MDRPNKRQFQLEALEPRILLSGGTVRAAAVPSATSDLVPAVVGTQQADSAQVQGVADYDPAAKVGSILTLDDPAVAGPGTTASVVSTETPPAVAGAPQQAPAHQATTTSASPASGPSAESGVGKTLTATSQVTGSPVTEQLTMTLTAANGPPVGQDGGSTAVSVPVFSQGQGGITVVTIGGSVGAGADPGGWGQINVEGLAQLGGTFKIQLANGFAPEAGQKFKVMTWGSRQGEFTGWLGTTGIPGHPDYYFQPIYSEHDLTLEVIEDPDIVGAAKTAIQNGLTTLAQIGNLLNTVGSLAQPIPFIGDKLSSFINSGAAIDNAIRQQIQNFLTSGPNIAEAAVTTFIQSWDGTNAGGIAIKVNSVVGHYDATGSGPFWWDMDLELTPAAVNQALSNIGGAVLAAAMPSPPHVSVQGKLSLSMSFGYDSGFFVKLDHLTAQASVNVSGLNSFPFDLTPPGGGISVNVTNGSVNFSAAITATPGAGILTANATTGPRIEMATLTNIASSSTNTSDAFNYTKTSSLNAAFTLGSVLSGFGFTFSGTTTVMIQSADLFTGGDPAVTVVTNGSLQLLGQTLTGVFTFKKTATETDLLASGVSLSLMAGSFQVLQASGGSGEFVLLGDDLAGTASLTLTGGPALTGVTLTGTTVNLALNTSGSAVSTIDGNTVNLPAGPYYRVSGHAVIGMGASILPLQASLTGDFVFEPKSSEADVAVSNLSFSFGDGSNNFLNVTNGVGAFVFSSAGVYGSTTATVSLAVPGVSLAGTMSVLLNTTTGAVPGGTVTVNGTPVAIPALAAGPYLQVQAANAQLTVLGIALSGNFLFENKATNSSSKVVTVAASGVSFNLGSVTNNLVNISNGSGVFIIGAGGVAGQASVTVGINAPGLTLGGTFALALNQTGGAVNQTVSVGGSPVVLNLPAGPYLQVNGTGVTLGFLGVSMTGNFSFEQLTSTDNKRVVTVVASNVNFSFGTSIVSATNGSGFFIINDAGIAGQGSITVNVAALGGLSHTFTWDFNNTDPPVNQIVNVDGIQRSLNEPDGPFNRLSSGGPVTFSVTAGGKTQSISAALVLALMHPDDNPGNDYVTVGVSSLSTTLAAGPVSLSVSGGTGAFVIRPSAPSKVAGLVTVSSASLTGVSAVSLTATNLKLQFNNTGQDVGPVTVSVDDNPADDVIVQFTGAYYHDYLAVAGAASLDLAGFVSLGGNFALEVSEANGSQFKVAATALHFDLKAGSTIVASFNQGTGEMVMGSAGLAGKATLQFQSGIIGMGGTISLEVNTTNSPVNVTVNTPPSGTPATINLTSTHYLKVLVNGTIRVGSVPLNYNFYVFYDTGSGEVQFWQTSPNTELVSIDSSGNIALHGPLAALTNIDFAKPDAFEFVSMLRQLGTWIDAFRSSSIFDVEIPFTGGKKLGDAFDWSQSFIDSIYSHMVSVEFQSTTVLSGQSEFDTGGLSAAFDLQFDSDTPVIVNVTGLGPYSHLQQFSDTDVNNIAQRINLALGTAHVLVSGGPGPQIDLTNRVVARKNLAGQLVIALTDSEVAKGTKLNLVTADAGMNTLGFGPQDADATTVEHTAVLTSRYATDGPASFFSVLADVLDDGKLNNSASVNYNAAKQVYTYSVNLSQTFSLGASDTLAAGDFANLADLVTKLRTHVGLVSQYLWNQFASTTQATLNNVSSTVQQKESALISELNRIIQGPSIYDAGRFAGVTLSADTSTLLATNPTGAGLTHLNRLLLQDAYPGDLADVRYPLAFTLSQDFGPIGGAALSASLNVSATVGMQLTLGFDLSAQEVPHVISSDQVPVPVNGQISADSTFSIYLNDDPSNLSAHPVMLTLTKASTSTDNSIDDLAAKLNTLFHTVTLQPANYPWLSGPTNLGDLLIAQKAGTGLAISAQSQQLGIINRIAIVEPHNDPFATELGFGAQASQDGSLFISASNASVKGLFVDNASLSASLSVASTPINGSLKLGFVDISTNGGSFGTYQYDGTTAAPITASLSLQDQTTGMTRLYISDLLHGTSSNNIGNMVHGPTLSGSFLARLKNISVTGLGFSLPLVNPQVSLFIPDIKNLNYNSNPYDPVTNNEGLFVTYPSLGSLQDLADLNFSTIIQALKAIADNLSKLSGFSFLDERLPLIDMSVNDMIGYAAKFASLIDAASNGGSQSLQDTLTNLKTQIDQLLHLDPSILTLGLDNNGLTPTSLVTSGGSGGSPSTTTINPNGDNNAFTVTAASNGTTLNGSFIRVVGSSDVGGTGAQVTWDATTNVLKIKINPGQTTTQSIVDAINNARAADPAHFPWTASKPGTDNSKPNDGSGTFTTLALQFKLNFSTAYANTLPFQLNLAQLLSQVAGNNPGLQAFLNGVSTIIQASGSGALTVSASAALTLDFGLDLSNTANIRPFLYDDTGVVLKARVAGTNLNFSVSLGSVVGIQIQNGSVTLDGDGNPATDTHSNPVDNGAEFDLTLRDTDGSGRHYFDSNFFSTDNINVRLIAGVSAVLPIYANIAGALLPLGSTTVDPQTGYPGNVLAIGIPDLARFFGLTLADPATAVLRFLGDNNDLSITSPAAINDYSVVLTQNSGLGTTAQAGFANNTLTIQINSGQTTALAVKTAVEGLGGGWAVAFLANDPNAVNTGAGTVTTDKLKLASPDFSSLFNNLDFCTILASATGPLLDGLDSLLGKLQDGINSIVSATKLPLIGDGLSGAANFIQDFRNGLLKELRDDVQAASGDGLTAVETAIKKAFWNTLGPGGLNLLVDVKTGHPLDVSKGFSQLDVKLDCNTGLSVKLRLAKELDLVDTSGNPIKFDIGVPGFGLQGNINVKVALGFDLKFGFGVSPQDGFYFDSSAPASDPELQLYFKVTLPDTHFSGQLLFLQLDVADDAGLPSLFSGHFSVDLKDPNGDGKLTFAELTSSGTQLTDLFHAELGADAAVNLDLAASFGGNTAFPRVLAQFHLKWHFDVANGAGEPQIYFDNIYLDVGSFISDFLAPILSKIQDVTKPLQPIIDVVQARIPILSDLAGHDITLLDLAQIFGLLEPSTVDFIKDVAQVITLINDIKGIGQGDILIPFGSFSLTGDNSGNMSQITPMNSPNSVNLQQAILNDPDPGVSSTYQHATAGFAGDLGKLHGFSIPVFDHPSELFNLFTGKPVRLVEWRMPQFKFTFTYVQKIPIYPPLYAQFGGSIGATINIGFGYDTYGIQQFINDPKKDPVDLLDGFYIITNDANGQRQPALTLTGEIFAGASIDLVIVEVGVRGGITATVNFYWNDNSDNDGKMRVSEIIANAKEDPRCIFNIEGSISLFLEAYLKINLFFFSIDKTWRFATITLVTFDLTCPEPVLGSMSGSVLTLNLGPRASQRLYDDTSDGSETFTVKHISGSAGNETVLVTWAQHTQQFVGVSEIDADGGQGDDVIDLRNVLASCKISGGAGNDTLYLSDGPNSTADGGVGDDTIVASSAATATGVVIHGGDGNDTITAGTQAGIAYNITIYGDGGNDTITGSPADDHLFGGAGDDLIIGGDGKDYIDGGDGNDRIDGGNGSDFILGGAGNDVINGGPDDDVIYGGDGNDVIYGGAGNDLLIGGNGNDTIYGDGGSDLLIGDKVTTVAGLTITEGNWSGLTAAIDGIATGGIAVQGIFGPDDGSSGNDFLVGGGGSDVMFGGGGDDFLYGGNFIANGDTAPIEEDGNDFMDGGPGNDTIFGDDSMGRTGDRNTGIAIKSSVWYDQNGNHIKDSSEQGIGGVTVQLYTASMPPYAPFFGSPVATTKTDVDGSFQFVGLDPNNYLLVFSLPLGLNYTARLTTDVGHASNDSDAAVAADSTHVAGQTDPFHVGYDETYKAASAGYTGNPVVSVSDTSVVEGNVGQTTMVFNVTLSGTAFSGQTAVPVEVDYQTADGNDVDPLKNATAALGDYVPVPAGKLIFNPGETSKQITVLVNGDTTYEKNQQFRLLVSTRQLNPDGSTAALNTNNTSGTATVLGTILNDDPVPTISISDYNPRTTTPLLAAGDFANLSDLLGKLTAHADAVSSFVWGQFSTADQQTLLSPSTTQTRQEMVLVSELNTILRGPSIYTAPRFAAVTLSTGTSTLLASSPIGDGLVLLNRLLLQDAYPTDLAKTIAGSTEGDPATFIVTLSNASEYSISVDFQTDTALTSQGLPATDAAIPNGFPYANFTMTQGTLTFQPGQTTKVITVQTIANNYHEGDTQFWVDLSNPVAATFGDDRGYGIIPDKDPAPSVTIIPLSPGPTSGPFTTDVIKDPSSPTPVTFRVQLSGPSGLPVTVTWATSPGTALEGPPGGLIPQGYANYPDLADYVGFPLSDTPDNQRALVFNPGGSLSQTITVLVNPTKPYANPTDTKTFFVNLLSANNATIAADPTAQSNHATVVIHQSAVSLVDTGPWSVYFSSTTYDVQEPVSGSTTVNITIQRTPGSSQAVAVFYTADGTATSGLDYAPVFRQLVRFDTNELSKTIPITIYADGTPDGDETVFLSLRNPTGGPVRAHPDTARLVIHENNASQVWIEAPLLGTLSLTSRDYIDFNNLVSKLVAHTDTVSAYLWSLFPVAEQADLAGASPSQVNLSNALNLILSGASIYDATRFSAVTLSAVTKDWLARNPSAPTDRFELNRWLLADAYAGQIAHPFYGLVEGTNAVPLTFATHDFIVHLTAPAGPGGVNISYESVDLTAHSAVGPDQDYQSVSGVLHIAAGLDRGIISVPVQQDSVAELNETFAVRLTGTSGPQIDPFAKAAVATIYDDDLTPLTGTVFYDTNGNGYQDLNEPGIPGVQVDVTYYQNGVPQTAVVGPTGLDGSYHAMVLLGQVDLSVEASTVKSPIPGMGGPGASYHSTTRNETQSIQYQGIVGLPAFADVGYLIDTSPVVDKAAAKNSGRGGTDDTIYGGPGNDNIDAGGGFDHVVGGFWYTATDANQSINNPATFNKYDADVMVTTSGLPTPYGTGPIFSIRQSSLNLAGGISGSIWFDANNNGVRDAGESFNQDVVVTLLDCSGNLVDSQVSHNGSYAFKNLYAPNTPPASEYLVRFDLPSGYIFLSPGGDNDVTFGNLTHEVSISSGTPTATLNAGIVKGGVQAGGGPGSFQFSQPSYVVTDTVAGGVLTITVQRGNSFEARAVVVRTEDATAFAGLDYTSVSVLLQFNVGESVKTVDIPIKNTNLPFNCLNPKYFNLVLRDPTGRPISKAPVFLTGPTVSDDDTIQGGDGWDIILGDSGIIPAPTIIDPTYHNLGDIVYTGGVGNDVIHGGNGPDFIDAGPGNDAVYGDTGEDVIHGGSGNDTIYIGLDSETIDGGDGFNTIVSTRDVPYIGLTSTGATTAILTLKTAVGGAVLSTHNLTNIQMAELFGGLPGDDNNIFAGAVDNTFDITNWNNFAFVVGNGGNDTLLLQNHVDMKLLDATFFESLLYHFLYGFYKDATLTVASGGQYDLSSVENVVLTLTGGAGGNTVDASGYSRPVTFKDFDGNDTLIGGSGNDTFVFNADAPLGIETIRGNGGIDTLDFSAGTQGVTVNLSTVGSAQTVNSNLQLDLLDKLENLTGGAGNDTLIGNDLANVIIGGTGNDYLAGGLGNDTYPLDTDTPLGSKTIAENMSDPGFDTLDFSGTTTQSINLDMSILNGAQVVNPNLTLTLQGQGIEQVFGGALDDVIRGNSNDNVLHGGPGNDIVDGKSGNDTLDGGPGNNTLIGGPGVDTVSEQGDTDFTLTNTRLTRGTGQTEILDSVEIVNLTGGPHANVFNLTGFTGTGSINGGDNAASPMDDTLIVNADANFTLSDTSLDISINFAPIALTGIDTVILTDGPGDHTLDAKGFTGEVTLIGGDGNDTFRLGSGSASHATVDGGRGTNSLVEDFSGVTKDISFVVQTDKLAAVIDPNAVLPAKPVQRLDTFTNVQSLTLTGGSGNNSYDVSAWLAGSLTLNGSATTNVVQAQLAASGVARLTDAFLMLPGSTGSISLNSIGFAILTGTAGKDTLDASGFSGTAILHGGAGDDVLMAGTGLELLDGGAGDDRFVFTHAPAVHTVYVQAGEGLDTLDFSGFSAPVAIDLSVLNLVQAVVAGDLAVDLLSAAPEVENVIGGSGGGTLTGNSLDNTFTITGGANSINGGAGTNTVAATADSNMTLINTSLTIGGVVSPLTNIQAARLTGGPANVHTIDASGFSGSTVLQAGPNGDTLIGGSGNDTLISGAGNDTLRGGPGNDTYVFNVDKPQGQNTVDELPGAVNGVDALDFSSALLTGVTVNLSLTTPQVVAPTLTLSLTHGDSIENVIGTPQIDQLIGNSLDNTLTGNGGADAIDGGTGTNTIAETRDADFILTNSSLTMIGSNPLFVATDIRDVAAVVARLQSDANPLTQPVSQFIWSQFSPATQAVLTNSGLPVSARVTALVTALNQVLQGSSIYDATRFSAVVLSAQTTALVAQNPVGGQLTRMNRLLLADTYRGDLAISLANIQQATLTGGAGNNILDASDFDAGAVTLYGLDGNDTLIGGYGNDRLDGGNGNDTLYGGAGSNILVGGAGNDILNPTGYFNPARGSAGNNVLMGGTGNDVYVFDLTTPKATSLNPNPLPPIPLGTATIVEIGGEGYADVVLGLGTAGVSVNLQAPTQYFYLNLVTNTTQSSTVPLVGSSYQLLLTLNLLPTGTIEFSF